MEEDASEATRIAPRDNLGTAETPPLASLLRQVLASDLTGKTLGGCTIQQRLGKGAMATVYLAKQLDLDRDVAVKVLSPRLTKDPRLVAAFVQEAKLLAKLEHPNVVPVYAVGHDEDSHFLVLQLVRGGSLQTLLKEKGRFSADEVLLFAQQIARGLQAAHRKGIVHRDIKPGNVLLTEEGALKLTDFGLAIMVDGAASALDEGQPLGTPHYMAPEQVDAAEVDLRADIYGLGATLYHLVTGVPPFSGRTPTQIMLKHLNETPIPAHERATHVPESLSRVIQLMMAKRPEDRYASCEALLVDLENPDAMQRAAADVDVVSAPAPAPQLLIEQPQLEPFETSFGTVELGHPRSVRWTFAALGLLIGVPVLLGVGPLVRVAQGQLRGSIEADPQLDAVEAMLDLEERAAEGDLETLPSGYRAFVKRFPDTEEARTASERLLRLETRLKETHSASAVALERARALLGNAELGPALEVLAAIDGSGLSADDRLRVDRLGGAIRADLKELRLGWIPPGPSPSGDKADRPRGSLEGFYLDLQEVSCADYAEFLRAVGASPPPGWTGTRPPPGRSAFPVTNVSLDDAKRYAKFRDKRLPTPIEWERAARGDENLRWPWGNDLRPAACNWGWGGRSSPRPVGAFPDDRSPFGCLDMAGNVSELTVRPNGQAVLKGGSWQTFEFDNTRAAFGLNWAQAEGHPAVGFRCATQTLPERDE